MDKIELKVQEVSKGISFKGLYVLLLCEVDGSRKLPIIIGQAETQQLAIALKGSSLKTITLLDLFHELTDRFNLELDEICIDRLTDGVFYASVVFYHEGELEQFDVRASDAVVLSLHYKKPLYIHKSLFEAQYMKELKDGQVSFPINSLNLTLLREALENAIRDENYELASQLRDEIKRRE